MTRKTISSGLRQGGPRRARPRPAAIAAALLGLMVSEAQADCADLVLVLAIDGSGSIDAAEFALQQQGYAEAFRNPRVQAALEAAGIVDVGVVFWGDTEITPQVLPLQRLRSSADAAALSRRIAGLPRKVHGNTGLGRGVATALDLLDAPGVCGIRKLVNVSGDGRETLASRPRHHVPLVTARDRARDLGVTINALAIETEVADLAAWYGERLITGPDAFVMRVDGFEGFAEAIVAKLEREIRPPEMAALHPADMQGVALNDPRPLRHRGE